jgi:exopolyphosphatase / guanosine-5'-triphosphate,3'-diphosphate pyrophosphatase
VTTIIPRWEWRTFGDDFGAAEDAFAAMESTGVQESDELYLLSEAGDTVKVRADLMDVKLLREVDAAGLERWEPVLKVGFPIAAVDLAGVFEALRIEPPKLSRETYTLDQFLDEVAPPSGAIRPVQVHKRRVRYKVNGCTSEVTDVVADGKPTRTIAIESEDAAAVVEAIRMVGLDGYVNTSYPKGLTALLEGQPARYAVIDVGTNSVKFHVGERGADGEWHSVVDRAEVTRLGDGMAQHGGDIQPAAQERTAAAIAGMADEALSLDVTAIAAVGTEGLRTAGNSDAVVAAFKARSGITVQAISGEEEGRLAYLAAIATTGHPDGAVVVFDTGGGSSQFTFGHGTSVDERFSVPVGAVRYTEQFGLANAVSPDVLAEAQAAIAGDLARIDGRPHPKAFIAMGGAVTNLAAVKHELAVYDPDVVHMTVLDRADLDREIELFRTKDTAERRTIVGLQPGRAEVILAGACIVRTVMDKLGQETLTVCDRGLRHGLLDERFGRPVPTH